MIKEYLFSKCSRYASKWTVLSIDLCIVAISFVLAYCIRFNLSFNFDVQSLWTQLPIVVALFLVAFLITGSHKGAVRHTGINDVCATFNVVCLASIRVIPAVMFYRYMDLVDDFTIPLSTIIINRPQTFMSLATSRDGFTVDYRRMMKKD